MIIFAITQATINCSDGRFALRLDEWRGAIESAAFSRALLAARIRSCRMSTTTRKLDSGGTRRTRIDLVADLNDEDDEGLGWSTLSEASNSAGIRPG